MKRYFMGCSFVIASLFMTNAVFAQVDEGQNFVEKEESNEISPFYYPTTIGMSPLNTKITGASSPVLFKLSFSGDYSSNGYVWRLNAGTGQVYQGSTYFTSTEVLHTYQLSPGQMKTDYYTSASVSGTSTDSISGHIEHVR